MFSLGGSEILVLAFLALLLFGNKNLPQNMKKMVKGLNEVKKVANEAQRSWREVRDDMTRQIMLEEAEEEAKKELTSIKAAIEAKPGNHNLQPGEGGDQRLDVDASADPGESKIEKKLPNIQGPAEQIVAREHGTKAGPEHEITSPATEASPSDGSHIQHSEISSEQDSFDKDQSVDETKKQARSAEEEGPRSS